MKRSRKEYYIVGQKGECGPFPWTNLRLWLALNWVPRNAIVRDAETQITQAASEIDRLWKIADRNFSCDDPSIGLASAKVPTSSAQRRYLKEQFNWPFSIAHLNYHNANTLRVQLEKIFPNDQRTLFYDKDWPTCWSWKSPAEEFHKERKIRSEPITERQKAILKFFGKEPGIYTKGSASDLIEDLLDDPENYERWESHKKADFSATPATEAQLRRLNFASKKRGHKVPEKVSKYEASRLIEKWYHNSPKLEEEYTEYKLMLDIQTNLTPYLARRKRENQSGCLNSVIFLVSLCIILIYIL